MNDFLKMSFAEAFQLSLKQAINITKQRRKGDYKVMNKKDLIDAIAVKSGLTKTNSGKALVATIETICTALASGKKVKITGLGTFEVVDCKERNGVNPQTGEVITIPAKKKPKLNISKVLKEAVNQ